MPKAKVAKVAKIVEEAKVVKANNIPRGLTTKDVVLLPAWKKYA